VKHLRSSALKVLLCALCVLCGESAAGQAVTLTGTFQPPSGQTPAAAGLRSITIGATAVCGELDFVPWDSSARRAVRLLNGAVSYGPQPLRAWIRCSDGALVNRDATAASVSIIPNTGSTPTGTVTRLRGVLYESLDGFVPQIEWTEEKVIPAGNSDWGNLAVAGITALTYTGVNEIYDEALLLTARTKLNFEGAGVACADDAANLWTECTITAGGAITVREVDGAPSVASVTALEFLQSAGFVVTDQTGGVARVDLSLAFSQISGAVTDAQVPDNITVNLAAAATALAADPADCAANQYANAIAASGALTCAQVSFAQLASTPTTLAGYGITDAQPLDADLTAIAALTRTRGDLLVGGATDWVDLAVGAAGRFLRSDGTDPSWALLVAGDVDELLAVTELTTYATVSGTGSTALAATFTSLTANDVPCWSGTNWVNCALSTIFADNVFRIEDNTDGSKELAFELSGLTTATTRTWTVPDASGEVSLLGQTIGAAELETDSVSADELNAAGVEAELEAVLDLPDLQGILTVAKGGTGAAPSADDQVLVSDSTSGATWRAIPDCDNPTASKLLYDVTTNAFSCGSDQTGAGGGDAITVATVAATDPDFINTARIAITLDTGAAPDTIAWDIVANSLGPTQIDETAAYAFSSASNTFAGASIAFGADPADAGTVRLPNGVGFNWETSPASTAEPRFFVDAAGMFTWDWSGTPQLTLEVVGNGVIFKLNPAASDGQMTHQAFKMRRGILTGTANPGFIFDGGDIVGTAMAMVNTSTDAAGKFCAGRFDNNADDCIAATVDVLLTDNATGASFSMAVRGGDTQGSVNLLELQNNAGTLLTAFLAAGQLAFGADPADAGSIRLSNNTNICWEASPAGTDPCLSVNTSEVFLFSNGTVQATMFDATTGFRIAGGATSGNVPVGDGGNFVSAQLQFSQVGGSVTDGQVPDTITAANYLLLAGGTLTGQLVTDNLGIEFEESDTNPTCAAGNFAIYADLSEGIFKKCQGGVATDLDTGGAGGDAITINGAAVTDADFDDADPAAPTDALNVKWQLNTTPSPDSISAYFLMTDIFKVGTITAGVWNGTAIAEANIDAAIARDAEVAAAYLALAGGTLTGQLVTDNLGIEFEESDTNPTCAAGNFAIYADLSEGIFKKCQDGVATDLDTGGAGGDSITVMTVAVTDPNFIDSVTIEVVEDTGAAPDTITWNVLANSIGPTQVDETASYTWTGTHDFSGAVTPGVVQVEASGFLNESKTNSVTSDQDFTAFYTIPANALTTGVCYRVSVETNAVTGVGTVNWTIYLKVGSSKTWSWTVSNPGDGQDVDRTATVRVCGTAAAGASANVITSASNANASIGNFSENTISQPVALATNGTLALTLGITFSATGSTDVLAANTYTVERLTQ
jgi:hypothetical protein